MNTDGLAPECLRNKRLTWCMHVHSSVAKASLVARLALHKIDNLCDKRSHSGANCEALGDTGAALIFVGG